MNIKFRDCFKDDGKVKIFTIPNVLTMLRICLIPVFIAFYLNNQTSKAFIVLLISGLTDVVDGFIARRFNMISSVGKALDPISDKLTQLGMLYCLLKKFKAMWIPFLLLIIKELFSGLMAVIAIKTSGKVEGADWHGKLATVFLYAMVAVHILWQGIPHALSDLIIGICVVLMVNSTVLYSVRNISVAKRAKAAERIDGTV